ncbi:SGNH/GDSL hydrolase family protein [Propionibacteriaceae bacterium G1746]|uniref:SGNH/GDSL hydrolase family protein n=1 Tax=Aestuariimicrobium sp. G57 TaxID=3418485 RepID=UPI003C2A1834
MNIWGLAGAAVGMAGLAVAGTNFVRGRMAIQSHVKVYAEHWGLHPDEAPDDALRYVALGDSAAQGVGASSVDKSYVSLLGARLAEQSGRPVVITNLSVSGAASDDLVRDQLDKFEKLPFEPDLVTMAIGGNDVVFPRCTLDSFTTSMNTILGALPAGSYVGDVPWFTVPGLAQQSTKMAQRAAELVEGSDHHLVPIHHASRELGYLKYFSNVAGDLFHPNDIGYAKWARVFWQVIEQTSGLERWVRAA